MTRELVAGAKAPAFTLQRDGGGKVSLRDFKGRNLVLYFYGRHTGLYQRGRRVLPPAFRIRQNGHGDSRGFGRPRGRTGQIQIQP